MTTVAQQFDAIMALPIGGAIIACALGFFFLVAGVVRHVIERRASSREHSSPSLRRH